MKTGTPVQGQHSVEHQEIKDTDWLSIKLDMKVHSPVERIKMVQKRSKRTNKVLTINALFPYFTNQVASFIED